MRFPNLILLLLVAGLVGCSGDSLLGVQTEDASSAVAAAKTGVKMVPLVGRLSHQVDPAGGFVPCLAPDGSVATMFPARLLARGSIRHLGRTTSVVTIDDCSFDPSAGTLYGVGMGYHTGANGDELHAEYAAILSPDGSFAFDYITFTGGTGRFGEATGWAGGGGMNDVATGEGWFWLEGMVSSVGSAG